MWDSENQDVSGFAITQIISRHGKRWSLFEVKALDEQMATEFDGYRNNYDYKVCGTGWLLLTVLESLQR